MSVYVKMPTYKQLKLPEEDEVIVENINFRSLESDIIDMENLISETNKNNDTILDPTKKLTVKPKQLKPIMSEISISDIEKMIEKLKSQIKLLDYELLNSDDENPKDILIMQRMKQYLLELEIDEAKKRQVSIDTFMKKALSLRGKNDKDNRKIFAIARNDAENRVFSIIALPAEEIAQCFSSMELYINPDKGDVKPNKFVYSWFHDLRKRDNNVIPLSPGIVNPKKFDPKTKEIRETIFMISFFFENPKFVERCQDYYRKFGLAIDIYMDQRIQRKWWIRLKVDNPENKIYFTKEIVHLDLDIKMVNEFGSE